MTLLTVTAVAGLATVQDGGRPGFMAQGVPPGGALAPSLLARANAGAENVLFAAAVEVVGTLTVEANRSVLVASDAAPRRMNRGERWTVACGPARVRYLAVRGGVDVPEVLGGRGTLLVAGFGGLEGRALRAGDRLSSAGAPPVRAKVPAPPRLEAPVRVVAGPDLDRFAPSAFAQLLGSTFTVSPRSDRLGVRLEGPALPRLGEDDAVSAPMVRGAIQVPASGAPIVLGPDHPTTGGYPVIATVVVADLGDLFARPVGTPVRFTA